MSRTYEGVLKDDRIEWKGDPDPDRGARMAAALSKVAEGSAFKKIGDPVEWQRQIRKDRPLPGREDATIP